VPPWLTAQNYWAFPEEIQPGVLEEIPLVLKRNMWFQNERASGDFAHQVREQLTATYSNRWIECGRHVAWAPRSPDHTPLDFFLWDCLKELIYSLPVDLEEDRIGCTVEAAATTRQKLHIFKKHTLQSLLQ
jgi:hypothetical protein